eukprot:m.232398 g.232398  ORF g.232398 m.232398 type:complete len:147 (+) comp12350_c0_seq1:218-658(+)
MEDVSGSVSTFEAALNEVERHLQPLLEKSPSEVNAQLDSFERSKLELTMAYTINSLFWMYLTTQGLSAKDYAVKDELERIRTYMKKIKDAEENQSDPNPRLNKEAAARFLKNALNQQSPADEAEAPPPAAAEAETKGKKRPKGKHS